VATETQGSASSCTSPGADRQTGGTPGDVKPVGNGISELRIDYGPGYRIYYLQEGQRLIVLLCGGDKSAQQKDIEEAKRIAADWKSDDR
jgi:putative addiction module killer protein